MFSFQVKKSKMRSFGLTASGDDKERTNRVILSDSEESPNLVEFLTRRFFQIIDNLTI
jgi:hypothetical protein